MECDHIVVTVYHDGLKDYFEEFLRSLNQQNNQDFCLYVFYDTDEFSFNLLSRVKNSQIVKLPKLSITENRVWIFNFLKSVNCQYIHFLDADDTIEPTYLKVSNSLLLRHDIVCHDFNLVDKDHQLIENSYWKSRFDHSITFISPLFLEDKNIIGLGNSSIRKELIEDINLKLKKDTKISDWFIFTQILLLKRPDIVFTTLAVFNYRQHENLANLLLTDYHDIKLKIEQVIIHFKALESIGVDQYISYVDRFEKLLTNFKELLFTDYKKERNNIHFFWWEEIFNLLRYYENRN